MKRYADQHLRDLRHLAECVKEEHGRQIRKWGTQKVTTFEWLAYLTEEVGELAEAISEYEYRKGLPGHIMTEAIQVATLALKIAEIFEEIAIQGMLDQRKKPE